MRDRLRSSILAFLALFFFMVFPADATFTWENNITITHDKVQWVYTEKYTEDNAIIYKQYIDVSLGNGDGFINAWEILKADVKTRSTLQSSILKQMDVIVNSSNGSLQPVVLVNVTSSMSPELLGPVMQMEMIKNIYTANYHMENPLGSDTGSISLIGEGSTPLIINMYIRGISVDSTVGIDNVSVTSSEEMVKIYGNFDYTGKATVFFHFDKSTDYINTVNELSEMNVTSEVSILNEESNQKFSLADRIIFFLDLHKCKIT
jgi:hypothetical protein